jgi:hypothetical protein
VFKELEKTYLGSGHLVVEKQNKDQLCPINSKQQSEIKPMSLKPFIQEHCSTSWQ